MPDPKLPEIDCMTIADFMRTVKTCDHRETVEPNDELARILATPYTTPERMKRRKLAEIRLRSRFQRDLSQMVLGAGTFLAMTCWGCSLPNSWVLTISAASLAAWWALSRAARNTERIYRSNVRK